MRIHLAILGGVNSIPSIPIFCDVQIVSVYTDFEALKLLCKNDLMCILIIYHLKKHNYFINVSLLSKISCQAQNLIINMAHLDSPEHPTRRYAYTQNRTMSMFNKTV